MKFKIVGFTLLFLSFVGLQEAMADGMNIAPLSVTNLNTLMIVAPTKNSGDTVEDFDARLGGISNMLSDQRGMGNLSPDQYNNDLRMVNQIIEGERRIREAQGGFLGTDQLDEGGLEQVEEQLDRISED
jgi:hypothetical protein